MKRLVLWLCTRFGWLTEDREPAIWWHSQNLTQDRHGRKKALWRHGRGWLRTPWGNFSAEWIVPTRFLHVGFTLGGGDGEGWGVEFACKVFAWWFHFEPAKFRGIRERSYQVSWHNGAIWVHWGTNKWGDWSRHDKVPRWRRWCFHPTDFLFGRLRYEKRELETVETQVPTPEGPVPARIIFDESTWRRPRWPWWPLTRRRDGANIELLRPIPIPGKGENAWDIDDDAIYSLSCNAKTVAEAVAAVVENYTRSRERHGGPNWKPAEVESA